MRCSAAESGKKFFSRKICAISRSNFPNKFVACGRDQAAVVVSSALSLHHGRNSPCKRRILSPSSIYLRFQPLAAPFRNLPFVAHGVLFRYRRSVSRSLCRFDSLSHRSPNPEAFLPRLPLDRRRPRHLCDEQTSEMSSNTEVLVAAICRGRRIVVMLRRLSAMNARVEHLPLHSQSRFRTIGSIPLAFVERREELPEKSQSAIVPT